MRSEIRQMMVKVEDCENNCDLLKAEVRATKAKLDQAMEALRWSSQTVNNVPFRLAIDEKIKEIEK